jgi:hypothetical protein
MLLAAALLMGVSGCDDPPTCSVIGSVDGSVTGDIDWKLEGADTCGMSDPGGLNPEGSALVFVARGEGSYQQLIVLVDSPVLGVADFPGQVFFVTPDDLWDSGPAACTIVLTTYTVEPWSRVDFVEFEGIVDCPNPLVSAAGDEGLTLTTIGVSGHIHDQQLSFQNI